MFTFRGIPCIYYGSEIEFKKGCKIDEGTNIALEDSGRAYFGDNIEGSVDVIDFGYYTNATGAMKDSLEYPLSLHIQRLNRLRIAIPALRKGQYSTEGCKGGMCFKRRYTDATTDSFALVAVSSDATFTGIPGGTYTDAITGDTQTVAEGGTLSATGLKGQGDLRVYVLDTTKTKAPGMIEGFSKYLSGGKDLTLTKVDVESVSLDKTSANLDLGESVKLNATVLPADATAKSLSWTSSDASVAVVSANGNVTAVGEGTATIYAAANTATKADYDNASSKLVARATVTVKVNGVLPTSVSLNKKNVILDAADTLSLVATVQPPNATAKYAAITWTSSDTKVATVDKDGKVTALKSGTTTITATTANGLKATTTVTVNGAVLFGYAMYFEKPASWGKTIYAYIWNDSQTYKNASWPGVAISVVNEADGIYGVEWPAGHEGEDLNIIFNDGGSQTSDLKAKPNGYYTSAGFDHEEANVEPTTKEETTTVDETTKIEETTKADETTKVDETTKEATTVVDQKETTKEEATTVADQKETTKEEATTKKEETTTKKEESDEPVAENLTITSFTAKKSGSTVEVGDVIKLKVETEGGEGTIQYGFVVKTSKGNVIIKNYSSKSYVNWIPEKSGTYSFIAYAKDDTRIVKKTTSSIKVVNNLAVKSFTVSKVSKKAKVGNKITLATKATGGSGKYQYKFTYKLGSSSAKVISNYSSKKSVTWKPKKAGTYKLRVYIKDKGTGSTVSLTRNYVVKNN